MTRDGVRFVINSYLERAGLKKPGLSSHGLRHTCGSLLYKETKDSGNPAAFDPCNGGKILPYRKQEREPLYPEDSGEGELVR